MRTLAEGRFTQKGMNSLSVPQLWSWVYFQKVLEEEVIRTIFKDKEN